MTVTEIKNYTNSLKPYIAFSMFLFIGSVFAGYFIAHNFSRETDELVNEMKQMFLPAREYSQLKIFMFIFENNATVLAISLLFSIIAGISSLLVIIANGIILGVFAVIVSENLSAEYFMAGILPHGFFEIPALILTSAVGFRIGTASLSKLFAGRRGLLKEIVNGFKFFILIIMPLIFIAALTEAFVTPILLSFFD